MKPRVPSFKGPPLTLRDFLHRSKVLKSYRDFMRELQGLDGRVAAELRAQIREGFAKNKGETNRATIKAQMVEGQRQLHFLRSYVSTARWKMTSAPEGTHIEMDARTGSWVGTGEADDVKGRLGDVWPWQSGQEEAAAGGQAVEAEAHRPLRLPKR